jgi:hypothetical protein
VSTFGQALPTALRDLIATHVDRALEHPSKYPPDALANQRAVCVHATDAMFVYYLGDDGAVYELDLDSSRGAEVVTSASTIRDVYQHAVARWPELGPLLAVPIVERVQPLAGLIKGFHAGVDPWNEKTETQEQAVARHLHYFADRSFDVGPAYVVQRIPSRGFAELHLAGNEPMLELELHTNQRVETLHRGSRAEIAAKLRSAELPGVIIALFQTLQEPTS